MDNEHVVVVELVRAMLAQRCDAGASIVAIVRLLHEQQVVVDGVVAADGSIAWPSTPSLQFAFSTAPLVMSLSLFRLEADSMCFLGAGDAHVLSWAATEPRHIDLTNSAGVVLAAISRRPRPVVAPVEGFSFSWTSAAALEADLAAKAEAKHTAEAALLQLARDAEAREAQRLRAVQEVAEARRRAVAATRLQALVRGFFFRRRHWEPLRRALLKHQRRLHARARVHERAHEQHRAQWRALQATAESKSAVRSPSLVRTATAYEEALVAESKAALDHQLRELRASRDKELQKVRAELDADLIAAIRYVHLSDCKR